MIYVIVILIVNFKCFFVCGIVKILKRKKKKETQNFNILISDVTITYDEVNNFCVSPKLIWTNQIGNQNVSSILNKILNFDPY